jgi:predicted small metal-binding protein
MWLCHIRASAHVITLGDDRVAVSRKEPRTMKTMTCKQLGGPCDFPRRGETADEVIKAQDGHLREMVAGRDSTHEDALKQMKGRWKHPLAGMGWYKQAKRDFADLPGE